MGTRMGTFAEEAEEDRLEQRLPGREGTASEDPHEPSWEQDRRPRKRLLRGALRRTVVTAAHGTASAEVASSPSYPLQRLGSPWRTGCGRSSAESPAKIRDRFKGRARRALLCLV